MALILWTGADAKSLKDVVAPVLNQYPIESRTSSNVTMFPIGAGPGDVVLACGSKTVATLQELGVVPKNRSVTSLREKMVRYNGASIFVTFDPNIVWREYERFPEIQWDIQLAIRYHNTGSVKSEIGLYRYVESFHELIERIEEKFAQTGRPVDLAGDLETKSFDPYVPDAWIIACSFTVDEGKSDVMYFEQHEAPTQPLPWKSEDELDYWEGVWQQINWILTTEKVSLRGANFKYDANWIFKKWKIVNTNQKFDTMLVGSLLDENRSNSLKLHAKIMTPMGGYEDDMDKYDFSCLEKVPKPELLQYVGGDTDATYRVAVKMKSELLKDKALTNFYVKLLQPSAKVFEKMERTGVCIDRGYYDTLQTELEAERDRIHQKLIQHLPNKLRIKYRDKIEEQLNDSKNPMTAKILNEFLFTPAGLNLKPLMLTAKTKEPSTSLDHLMMFNDHPEAAAFIADFSELGSVTKTLSTYVVGFLKHLRHDGRFHATYMLHRGEYGGDDSGTNTGRTSAKDPAVQTIPKHTKWSKRLRKGYVAPPGYVILNVDFSQGELRITAVVANEETMIKAYAGGADLHAITAAQLNGYTMDQFMLLPEDTRDALRSGGKAGNFGLIYGMGAPGFKTYAFNSYGVKMTDAESVEKRDAFFTLYNRLPEWHEESKQLAHRWGFVRSPLGRVRHLPLINSKDRDIVAQSERQSINSPVQSCLSDMMQLAMVHIDREYGDKDIHMFMMCHDALSLYVPEAEAVDWAKRIKCIMENLPLDRDFGWNSPLKFYADAEVGPNLAELKKLKGL